MPPGDSRATLIPSESLDLTCSLGATEQDDERTRSPPIPREQKRQSMNLSDRSRTTSPDMGEASGYSTQKRTASPDAPLCATTGDQIPSVAPSMQEATNTNEEPIKRGTGKTPHSAMNFGIQTNDAQVVIDYLDQVRGSCVPCLGNLSRGI